MKLKLLFFLSILLFVSCNNAVEWVEPVSQFSVLMNGEPWEENPPPVTNDQVLLPAKKIQGFYSTDCKDTTIRIIMVRGNYENYTYNREEFIFNKIPYKTGKYQCMKKTLFCHQYTLVYSNFIPLIGDDVFGKIYETIDTEDNYISIDSIEKSSGVMSGKFQVTFLNLANDKDTVRFTEGAFKVLLSEH